MYIKDMLSEIRDKYHLEDGIEDLFVNREVANIWYEYTHDLLENSVVIFGAGGNTRVLLRMLISWGEIEKIKYIYDSKSKVGTLLEVPVKNEMEFSNDDVQLIWISSFFYREEMKDYLSKMEYKLSYVDLYDVLAERISGTEKKDIFIQTGAMRSLWFSDKLKERESALVNSKKQRLSQELIAGYFCIYDWVNFFKEIKDYLNMGYPNGDYYLKLEGEVKNILLEFEKELNTKTDCVVVYVIDCLSQFVGDSMSKLARWKESAMEFRGYRCEYPGTREAFASLLTGWRPFEDKTFAGKIITYSDSDLLRYIYDKGIRIKYLSDDYVEMLDFREINNYKTKFEENALLSEAVFNGLCELNQSDEKQIIIIHVDSTVHYPHITPITRYTDYNEAENPQVSYNYHFDISVKYTDEILGFYNELLDNCEGITQIVMGDHGIDTNVEFASLIMPGPDRNQGMQWSGKVLNPELIIKKKNGQVGIIDKLISSNQFSKLLYNLLNNNDPMNGINNEKSLPIEWVPGWNPDYIQRGFDGNNYYFGIGGAGCINQDYMYIETEEGEEFYFKVLGQDIERIENESDIEKARKSLGEEEISNNKFPISLLSLQFFDQHNRSYNNYRFNHSRRKERCE